VSFEAALEMARIGRLYPGVILYGAGAEGRHAAALELGRALLCDAEEAERPCGVCRHCRRVAWPEGGEERFHPDFHVLERDLKTTTSIDATKRFLAGAAAAPFEARGQVFVLAEADSLSGGAADALLKILEEPPSRSPRHFLLLAGSRSDLLPTLRSRSLAIYLGGAAALDAELVAEISGELGRVLDAWSKSRSPIYLLAAADVLGRAPGWEDVRAKEPWATAAAAVVDHARSRERRAVFVRALLELADALLGGWQMRLRGITAERIREGLVSRHLGRLPGP
jgi:DNA polymerase III delta prime subunit